MEPAAAWGPACGFQLANWPVEELAAAVWAPTGFPVEYVQGPSGGQQQLVEQYYYSAASQQEGQNRRDEVEKNSGKHAVDDPQNRETSKIISHEGGARDVCKQVKDEFRVDMDLIEMKMHRYPASLRAVDEGYTVPRIVAIGPYHHHRAHLKAAEKGKHAAAIHCVLKSGYVLEDLYPAVAWVADKCRHLYDKDVMAGIGYDDFRHMMFFDDCFLVQYVLWQTLGEGVHESLHRFFSPNRKDIRHDIALLENQLPWKVVKKVMGFMAVKLKPDPFTCFASRFNGFLQDQQDLGPKPTEGISSELSSDENEEDHHKEYQPPHLLALLRHHTVGKSHSHMKMMKRPGEKDSKRSISVSAMELAEIGIRLTANKSTTELSHMGLQHDGTFFAELSMAPLSLDHHRASYLVNMAALELCMAEIHQDEPEEDSAVCSYLRLLAMLVYREEDVHELRARGVLQGGGGLTNKEALRFFTSLQGLPRAKSYVRIMADIERYKENKRVQTKLHAFYHNNKKSIAAVVSGTVAVGGIIGTLLSVKNSF
ncbi:hypothetical protein BS78_05G264500 [Paspalum vaginatum]|nr:hypothetical protein BS78_05G264500 [Paspalum vaginatum]KAJ1277055.1 hypothetical protein BS78_05G264500 [Paspalum vaginatum]